MPLTVSEVPTDDTGIVFSSGSSTQLTNNMKHVVNRKNPTFQDIYLNAQLLSRGISTDTHISVELPATVGTVGWSSTQEEVQQNLKRGL